MSDSWYENVGADTPLTQGDIIYDCPLIGWQSKSIEVQQNELGEILKGAMTAIEADVVVMTQACDLAQNKVNNVILCPHQSIDDFRKDWEGAMKAQGQNPTFKAWRRFCDDIQDGYIWNLAILNQDNTKAITISHRIVDFRDIYTVPREFLESVLQGRAKSRLRLLPPYREHLSQAFARFFMRVGLPTPVTKVW